MDSSNSGSFQSSSGPGAAPADTEEFDSSTPHSISSFFNHFNPNLNHLLHPPPPPPTTTTTTFFTPPPPFSTYPINPNPSNTNKDHHHHHHHQDHHQDHHHHHQDHHHHHQDHHQQIGVTMKNPKKRTRASRRAPTTVLTTDTTNFRQMVQEFTGIPTSPFTATAFSRRLELFRPTAQKLQPPAPPLLNPMANNNNNIIVDSSTCNNNNNNNNITSSSYHLHPSSIHDLQKQPSTLLDLQNHPMLSFQSLLQTSVPQESSDLNGLQSTSGKRWRDQNEKLESFEDDNIVRSNVVVSSRSGGDQVQGNNNQRFMDLPF